MKIRIKLFGSMVVILWILNCVTIAKSQVSESCYKCDDAELLGCGLILETGATTETCLDTQLGCYVGVYQETEGDLPGSYTKRGCLENYVGTCQGDSCLICKGENCNGNVFPADRHKCLKCAGDDCDAPESQYCSIFNPSMTNCITLYDEESNVIGKNCLSDIPDISKELCTDSTYLDCEICVGADCNTNNIRAGTKCYQCNGLECLIANVADIVDCNSPCYIGTNVRGETVRGCAIDFPNKDCAIDDTDTKDCLICDGDLCNALIYPLKNRLQCHTCSIDNCDITADNVEYCSTISNNERCATVFSNTENVVTARGCVTTLSSQETAICDQNDNNCLKCAYNNCNRDTSNLKTEFCIECNSKDDPNCLKANSNLEQRCSTNQCYTRLLDPETNEIGRHLERGCAFDLTATCTDPNCERCTGKNCNNKLFPANRISCKFCENNNCIGKTVEKICSLFSSPEGCVTFYGDGSKDVIYRNCYSDTILATREICDDPANLQCSKCSSTLCNTDSTRRGTKCIKCTGLDCFYSTTAADTIHCASECYVGLNTDGTTIRDCADAITGSSLCVNGNPNCLICGEDLCNSLTIPMENRLSCLQCVGDSCLTEAVNSDFCEVYHANERCVTVFDSTNKVNERGCSSSVQNKQLCDANDANCLKCTFDNCNTENSNLEIFHCVSCDSLNDPNCVEYPLTSGTAGCIVNACYTRLLPSNPQYIERGCASGAMTCTGERCNSGKFPTDRLSCLYCVGDDCGLSNVPSKQCLLYSSDKSCFTFYGSEDQVIYRNCYVDSALTTKTICDDLNDLSCSKCTGESCNKDTKRRGTKCFKCSGIECFYANYPTDVVDCATGSCYVGLNANGETVRDCASAITNTATCATSENTNADCLLCQGDLCNGISYPMQKRLTCQRCIGEICDLNENFDEFCERVHEDERCVTVFNSNDHVIERGCLSTVQNQQVCGQNDPNCLKCSFINCNTEKSKTEAYHCVSCNSMIDPMCGSTSIFAATKACTTNQCYSRLLPSANEWQHIEKGCAVDLAASITTSTKCTGERCNNILYPTNRFSCYSCRGAECLEANIQTKVCRLYNQNMQGCVTLFGYDGNVNYRDCYSDSETGTREICDDTSQLTCTKCTTTHCNQDKVRRGSMCLKCQGTECFNPTIPADVVDCTSICYVGMNVRGETVRDCANAIPNSNNCGTTDDGINTCITCTGDLCNAIAFPLTNRLMCQTCSGDNCEGESEYCERINISERCITVFSTSDDKVIERGCSSNIQNNNICQQTIGNCITCGNDGCNNATSKLSKQCLNCDSSTDANCVINPIAVSSKTCKTGCYTRLNGENLVRGCLEDLGSIQCNVMNNCKTCDKWFDKCNTDDYPTNRKSCRTCQGVINCQNAWNQACIRHKENDECVSIFDGYRVSRRGCRADLSTIDETKCSGTNLQCARCSSNNCNTLNVRSDENCIVCNSALEANCAQKPTILTSAHCRNASDGFCFTRIQGSATLRGCRGTLTTTQLAQCTNTTECRTSFGQGSNNIIIPTDRLKCYYCDSRVNEGCADEQTDTTKTLPCKKYSKENHCIEYRPEDGIVIRGCQSDFSWDLPGQVYICNNTMGCNKNNSAIIKINIFCLNLTLFVIILTIFKK